MEGVRTDAEGGLQAFLDAQATVADTTTVSLYQFNDRFEVVYEGVALAEVPPLKLVPRGTTALYDAIGEAVTRTDEQIAVLDAGRRPDEVIAVIQTDGQENASREYNARGVKRLIATRQQSGWTFVFLSADPSAFAVADSVGISRDTTIHYGGDKTRDTLTSAGQMVARGSESGVYGFTEEERDASRSGE
ncbi:hypothetical protein C1I98_28390 [Spongiactinospora gelatinilytica]|uniref:VWA domain-containing protein n=2 Tax=Spongiactinospora gelatinilytica TaxID=2666298 RepID=A0A2W2H495_9ACTN|nr:hypothetical protein C1I98_28390 [Spongiactinospora gelatinilytica]